MFTSVFELIPMTVAPLLKIIFPLAPIEPTKVELLLKVKFCLLKNSPRVLEELL